MYRTRLTLEVPGTVIGAPLTLGTRADHRDGLGESEAAVEREVASLGLRCRRIAVPASRGIVLEELSDDALVAIEITMVQGSASALTQFAGATGTAALGAECR